MALDHTVLATTVLWFAVIVIHVLSCAFYGAVAYVYHMLPDTQLSADMKAFQLSIDMKFFPVVVVFHAICSALHLGCFVEMGVQSIRHRRWYFHRTKVSQRTAPVASADQDVMAIKASTTDHSSGSRRLSLLTNSISRTASSAWQQAFGYAGFFGIHSKHFTLVFLVREVIETILQSAQAFNLSYYVPRIWLNRFAVAVVTMGCWSTPLIQHFCHHNPRLELILCLLFDVTLDFASSVGVTSALAMIYWPDYDPVVTNFEGTRWFDLAWYAHMTNEFQLLFIQTWIDFGSRALFAVTLLLCLDDVKFLAGDSYSVITRQPKVKTESRRAMRNRRIEMYAHVALVAWGCLILGFHSEAAFDNPSADCIVQARPWLTSKSACAYLAIDCQQHAGMVGAMAEVETKWSDLEPKFLSFLSLSSCPKLSMPPSIQAFTNLVGLYVINATLEDWSDQAALTKQHHPSLHHFAAVSVDLTKFGNGTSLPAGLMSRDFPPTLRLIYIASCKLKDLPIDLDKSWPVDVSLIMPANVFTKLPDVVPRLNLMRLIISANPITELPAALFETSSLNWLEILALPITKFPADVKLGSALRGISFQYSQVTVMPDWMLTDKFVDQVQVHGGGTPYCVQLQSQPQDAESVKLASRYCSLV